MTRPLPALAADLAAAADAHGVLAVLNAEVASEKKLAFALLAYDARRQLILGQGVEKAIDAQGRAQIAVDHLPTPVRQAILAGDRFADVGDQSAQYAKLLGVIAASDDCRLYLRGLVVDGALIGVLATTDGRRRAPSKVLEVIEPLGGLSQLAFARLHERDARFEAVTALHEITTRLRATHTAALQELEQEIARLRDARGDVIDRKRVEQLEAASENAKRRATTAESRLEVLEHQVSSAVQRLERAHTQLHQQTETLRIQHETIQQLEHQLLELGAEPQSPPRPTGRVTPLHVTPLHGMPATDDASSLATPPFAAPRAVAPSAPATPASVSGASTTPALPASPVKPTRV